MAAQDRRFVLLAAGTIFFIQASCVIEEWIFKQLPGFRFHWFVALVELALFALLGRVGLALSPESASLLELPPRRGPLHLYVLVGLSLAAGTGLGKVAYRYLNYATGTVLKSMKLLPVMAISFCWLRRGYTRMQVLASVLMVTSAALFGLGDHEAEPSFHPLGLLLSFGCLVAQALQNNAADRLLRDHGAPVSESMLYSNGVGALAVLLVTLCNGELLPACGYFARTATGSALLVVRCLLFYVGAMLYTMLIAESGAVAAVFVTTMRKALTVVVSFLVFPKPWSDKYTWGGLALLLAIYCEFHGRVPRDTRRPRREPSGTAIDDLPRTGEDHSLSDPEINDPETRPLQSDSKPQNRL